MGCNRCRSEGGSNPLRSRCVLCTSACDPSPTPVPMPTPAPTPQFPCGKGNSDDCCSEFNNARRNNQMLAFCNRCFTEGGSDPLRNRCHLCHSRCPPLTAQ